MNDSDPDDELSVEQYTYPWPSLAKLFMTLGKAFLVIFF